MKLLIIILIVILILLYLTKETFIANGNVITSVNNRTNVKFPYNAKMTGFKLESENNIKYKLSLDNERLKQNTKDLVFLPNKFYNFNKVVEYIRIDIINLITSNEEELDTQINVSNNQSNNNQSNRVVFKFTVYGIYDKFNKIENLEVSKGKYGNINQLNISFDKIKTTDVSNILYYFIMLGKYDYEKIFINKKIINIKNYELNFDAELAKIDLNGITVSKRTTLRELNNFNDKERLFKLLINAKFFDNSTNQNLDDRIYNILNEINDIADFKMDIVNYIDSKSFVVDYEQNIFYNQSNEVKNLLKYLYNLIQNVEDCMTNCSYTLNNIEDKDINGNKFYYKVGIGYVRKGINGDEIMSDIVSYRDDKGEQLITFVNEKEQVFETDNIYNKLVSPSSGIDFKGDYPNDFLPNNEDYGKYIYMNENKVSKDGEEIGILDVEIPNIDVNINLL